MIRDLESAQAELRNRNKRPPQAGAHTVQEARARVTIKETMKRARALLRKKHADHRRFLALKKERKVLTRTTRDELKSLLASFVEMNRAMKDVTAILHGVRDTAAQRSQHFQDGYRLGREHTQVIEDQKRIDQQ